MNDEYAGMHDDCPIDVQHRHGDTVLASLTDVIYGGMERPSEDADILRAVAKWLDRIDDVVDENLAERGSPHRVGRAIQTDLRRIADRLP